MFKLIFSVVFDKSFDKIRWRIQINVHLVNMLPNPYRCLENLPGNIETLKVACDINCRQKKVLKFIGRKIESTFLKGEKTT